MVVVSITASREIKRSKTLIFGAYGMLGHDLQAVYPDAVLCGRETDITDRSKVMQIIRTLQPALVINAAAYTDVEGCEDHQDHAFAVNGHALEHIATACSEVQAKLIHYSTDYVFDGSKTEYVESDRPNPLNIYGASKLLGERMVQEHMDNFSIIRTSWLFGKYGKNFVYTMLTLSKQMDAVKVVNDQYGKPTYTVDLARKTPEIAKADPGIHHITNDGVCTWYEFAQAVIPNAVPCTSDEFPRKARRPKYSVLENTKSKALRPWRESLNAFLSARSREEYS
jgi:dTDP-4-dehydrorhamnose reductase